MSNLRSKIVRLAHQNPELRPHLLPLISRTAAGKHPLNPEESMMTFVLVLEQDVLANSADEGDELAIEVQENEKALERLEEDALRKLSSMFGVKIDNEGMGPQHGLICKFSVDSWNDVARVNKAINQNRIGSGDKMDTDVPFFAARGFVLYPEGINGPRYGKTSRAVGDLDQWLRDNKE